MQDENKKLWTFVNYNLENTVKTKEIAPKNSDFCFEEIHFKLASKRKRSSNEQDKQLMVAAKKAKTAQCCEEICESPGNATQTASAVAAPCTDIVQRPIQQEVQFQTFSSSCCNEKLESSPTHQQLLVELLFLTAEQLLEEIDGLLYR